ncbi:MAG: DUF6090 family protein [Bacteroidetes bacterium]|nr:DUF6090 family protein [Bacteroidota bacterium]MDA1119730.1 DUF6090 family protein [Bacteroidota bacterium]
MKKLIKHLKSEWYKYGIETLVVVVGIQMAFALNNWNEQRKIYKQEIELQVKLNLNSNIKAFNQNINEQKDITMSIDLILDHLENKKPYNDSLPFHFRKLMHLEQFTVSTSAYQRLKSSGFDIIQSESLRIQIIQLFETTYPRFVNSIKDIALQRFGVLQGLFDKYFRAISQYETVPNNYCGLQNNQEFINWIYNRRAWKSALIGFNQELIDQTDELIINVNKSLGD